MKRSMLCLMVFLLGLFVTTSARTGFYSGSGSILVEISSSFFMLEWGLDDGSAHFEFNGPSISNITDASSDGRIEGTFDVTQSEFTQTFNSIDAGSFSSLSSLPSGVITYISFTGEGVIEQRISVCDIVGKTDMLVWLDASYFWLYVKDDRPPLSARFLVDGIGFDGNRVRMLIRNAGNIPYEGPATIKCGLSYKPWYWISSSLTQWEIGRFDYVKLEPGDMKPFDFFLPETIPDRAIRAFFGERDAKLFESDWWKYPNPETDCFDFIVIFGDSLDVSYQAHGFSPVLVIEK